MTKLIEKIAAFLTIKKSNDGTFWRDRRGNTWSTANTRVAAYRMSTTLVDCLDCQECKNCRSCVACSNCTHCTYCHNCMDCMYCSDCAYCCGCSKCASCTFCDNDCFCKVLQFCSDCNSCSSCEHSQRLVRCVGVERGNNLHYEQRDVADEIIFDDTGVCAEVQEEVTDAGDKKDAKAN